MSKQCRVGMTAGFLVAFAAAATLFVVGVGHVEGAKSAPVKEIYLAATLEPLWFNAEGAAVDTRILNDDMGPYINQADTKSAKYGVTVKYILPSGGLRGQFVMNLDRAGILKRFVTLKFENPVTGTNCRPKPADEAACAPLRGFMDGDPNVETRSLSISTQILLDEIGGNLVRNTTSLLNMDKMVTGQRKVVGLGISFTPDVAGYDYAYDLGNFTDPENYIPGLPCQDQNFVWGPAELVCLATGQSWEFRPGVTTYYNEPNGCLRFLWGRVLNVYWRYCRSDKWDMPFVLRVNKI